MTRRQMRARTHVEISHRERALESLALSVGSIAFVLVAAVALAVFQFHAAPISGEDSLGQFAALASAVVAVLAFAAGRYVVREQKKAEATLLTVLDTSALALAHAIIALLSWTLLAVIMERGFVDAEVYPIPLLVLAGAAAAVTAYVTFFSATHMDLSLLAVVLAVFLVEGVIASMLTANDPHWWQLNLSALGMTDDISALAFNLSVIVGGFIVTILARYSTVGIPTDSSIGILAVRVALIVIGIMLGLVGLFPVDDYFVLHTTAASGMAAVFAVLVIMLPKWISGMPRPFILLGWLFIAIIVGLAVLFAREFYTLTAVELVAGILVFTWIILFLRNAGALATDASGTASE